MVYSLFILHYQFCFVFYTPVEIFLFFRFVCVSACSVSYFRSVFYGVCGCVVFGGVKTLLVLLM
jgi:hypothetical protein